MNPLLDAAIRSSLVLLLGLIVIGLLRTRAAALRHAVLAASIVAAALIVPLARVAPAWTLPSPAPQVAATTPAARGVAKTMHVTVESAAQERRLWLAVPALWALGSAVALAVLALRIRRVAKLTAAAGPIVDHRWIAIAGQVSQAHGLRRPPVILQTSAPDLIATWGVFAPCILIPPPAIGWSDARIRAVLSHELAHVRRGDWIVQIGAEIVRAVYWFNPLITIACTRLRRESEQACDDAVLGLGVPAPAYAEHLLALAHTCRPVRSWAAAVTMVHRSTLERRIAAMLNTRLDHRTPSSLAILIATALLLATALPLAAFRAAQTGPLPLTGSIYDSSGAVLPGVAVTLQDAQEFRWEATTDASGQFDFPPVQPGRYVLEGSLPGFIRLKHEFELKNPRDWSRSIVMAVGELKETVTVSASRTTGSSLPQGPVPVRVGGNIRPPKKILNVNPVYPESMREAGLSGVVPIEAIIGVDGFVLSARVHAAHVHPDFAAAALEAVRQWQFTPTLLNGTPVEVVMNVSVSFQIED